MKKSVKIILISVSSIIGLLLIILLTNKTFFKGEFKSIPIPRGSYYINSNTFYNIRSKKSINKSINKYLSTLESCYNDEYYYDKDSDISIIKYKVEDNGIVNKITLDYEKGNICDVEFSLSDEWYKDIKKSDLKEVELITCRDSDCLTTNESLDIDEFIDSITKLERVANNEFVDFSYKDNNSYLGIYFTDDETYSVAYKLLKYNDYLAVIAIDTKDNSKNALYKIDGNINKYIESLVKE